MPNLSPELFYDMGLGGHRYLCRKTNSYFRSNLEHTKHDPQQGGMFESYE
jgi:predicted HD phosphohydrolase